MGDSEKNAGGKTKAVFGKSKDQYFMFKQVEQKEINVFGTFGESYFKHLIEKSLNKQESLLNKILGVFKISIDGKSQCYILMENQFFGLDPRSNCRVYDLKGSEINRLNKEGSSVLLDTNYKIDMNGEPLHVQIQDFEIMINAIKYDINFLSSSNIVDYSLLLIIDNSNIFITVGIIDYL